MESVQAGKHCIVMNIHTGDMIKAELKRQRRSITWLAEQLCCSRTNVYKIIHKSNLDIELLWRISNALQHDFFKQISDQAFR